MNPWKQGFAEATEYSKNDSENAEYPVNPYVNRDGYKEWQAGLQCGFKAFFARLREQK